MTDEKTGSLEGLNKKVDAVIDHTATQLGKLEAQARATSDVLEQLSTDFIDSHDALSDQFKSLEACVNNMAPEPPDRRELYGSLAAAQAEIKNATLNIENEFLKSKYADLASCLNAVRGPLSKNGIALIQLTEDSPDDGGTLGIRTILAHESGQTIEDVITMYPPKSDPQGIGSCRTYMRRYAVMAMCGIAGAMDDDAERTKARLQPGEVDNILIKADELFGNHAEDACKAMLKNIFADSGAKVIGEIPAGNMEVAVNYLERMATKRKKDLEAAQLAEEAEKKKAAAEKKK